MEVRWSFLMHKTSLQLPPRLELPALIQWPWKPVFIQMQTARSGVMLVTVQAAQDITAAGKTLFWVANGNYQNLGPGHHYWRCRSGRECD